MEGRVEPLDVAYLEYNAAPPRSGHQLIGFRPTGAERLFDQQVDARFEELAGDPVVQAGRGGDYRGVDVSQEVRVVLEGRRLALASHPLAIRRQRIDDRQQFHVLTGH